MSAGRDGTPPRILVVDDHPDNLTILRARLEALGYCVDTAQDGEEALVALGAMGPDPAPATLQLPDLILLDVRLPKLDGFEVARRIKRDARLPFIPVIMQTALDATADKVLGFDAGADDYITKPINFPELEARIRSLLRIKSLQAEVERRKGELEALNDHLVRIAQMDALTGIENRRRLEERLEETLDASLRQAQPFAVMMCDLDRFKAVNDTYGHQAGDAVLHQFAQLLRARVRGSDRVGRYGGEEFLVILTGATPTGALTAAERLRRIVEGATFEAAEQTIRRTMSCGLAPWPHTEIRDARGLVRAADDALYRAKARGRNCVVEWSGSDRRAGRKSRSAIAREGDANSNGRVRRPDRRRREGAAPAD